MWTGRECLIIDSHTKMTKLDRSLKLKYSRGKSRHELSMKNGGDCRIMWNFCLPVTKLAPRLRRPFFSRGRYKTHLPRLRRSSFLTGRFKTHLPRLPNSSTEATTKFFEGDTEAMPFFWGFHWMWLDSVTQNHAFCYWHAWTALYDFWNSHSWLNEKYWQFGIKIMNFSISWIWRNKNPY